MRDGKILNNAPLTQTTDVKKLVKISYGMNSCTKRKLEQRLEFLQFLTRNTTGSINGSLNIFYLSSLMGYFESLIPEKLNLKALAKSQVITSYLISSYKGYRHLRGLPVNGQRTWTNGWSSYRTNYTLRNFKLESARKFYGNISYADIKTAFLAEQTNLIWKQQWYQIWKKIATNRSVKASTKNKKSNKPDVLLMSKGHIFLPLIKKDMTKKQKTRYDQSIFACGYRVGFSKNLLKELTKYNAVSGDSNVALLGSSAVKKKKQKKKTNDQKTKQIKHKQKKQKKKSIWD